jgi:hypothetical protein
LAVAPEKPGDQIQVVVPVRCCRQADDGLSLSYAGGMTKHRAKRCGALFGSIAAVAVLFTPMLTALPTRITFPYYFGDRVILADGLLSTYNGFHTASRNFGVGR